MKQVFLLVLFVTTAMAGVPTTTYEYKQENCKGSLRAFKESPTAMTVSILTQCGAENLCETNFTGLPVQKMQIMKDGDCLIKIGLGSKGATVNAPANCLKLYCKQKGRLDGKYTLKGTQNLSELK